MKKLLLLFVILSLIPTFCSADTTTTTIDIDTFLDQANPTNNYGGFDRIAIANNTTLNSYYRTLINFTLPVGEGTITAVKLYLYKYLDVDTYTCPASEVHELTQTAWTEMGATWNKYDGVSNWISGGGDFDATIIDTTNDLKTYGNYGWEYWNLMGDGSDNPLTLNWNDNVYLLLKYPQGLSRWFTMWKSSETSTTPYIEITYTPLVEEEEYATFIDVLDNLVLFQFFFLIFLDIFIFLISFFVVVKI